MAAACIWKMVVQSTMHLILKVGNSTVMVKPDTFMNIRGKSSNEIVNVLSRKKHTGLH
jgi:peptidyl-tRNA hydrolase